MKQLESFLMPAPTPLEALADAVQPCEPYPEAYYWLWLAQVLGPAHAYAGEVIDYYGDAARAYALREEASFARLVRGAAAKRAAQKIINPQACEAHLASCREQGILVLTFDDPDYPQALAQIPDPPVVLYATGDVRALHAGPMIGMVGTRRPTAYGAQAMRTFAQAFAQSGAVVVSGLADGLDSEGHRAVVAVQQRTIGVLGVPITQTYPSTNRTLRAEMQALGGLTLSEYPEGFPSDYRRTFLQRNRIIAALSQALVVVEARSKSGTMSTVNHAERYGCPIFAVPGSIFSTLSEGTNDLLRTARAKALVKPEDVLDTVHLTYADSAAETEKPLTNDMKRVIDCLGVRPVPHSRLLQESGLSIGALSRALSELEMRGRVVSLAGKQYQLQ